MKVQLSWKKSSSLDVVNQELAYQIKDLASTLVLPADVEKYVFTLNEGDTVQVSLRAFNGKKYSAPAVSQFTMPTVPAPEPPIDLLFTVLPD